MDVTQFVGQPSPNGPISGAGSDAVGPFHFKGEFDNSGTRVRFVKQYDGKHAIYYMGNVKEFGLEGDWGFAPGGKDGTFKMSFK